MSDPIEKCSVVDSLSGAIRKCRTFFGAAMLAALAGVSGFAQMPVASSFANLSEAFEVNHGITDPRVDYLAHGPGHTLFLRADEAVVELAGRTKAAKKRHNRVVRMKLLGADRRIRPDAHDLQSGRSNYFIGNDPREWRTNVPQYGRIEYRNVYPGISVVYHATHQQLEYDFVVDAGADLNRIRLAFEGAEKIRVDRNGDLVLETGDGEIRQRNPMIFVEDTEGKRLPSHGRYVIRGSREVGFEVEGYDRHTRLIIDPVLTFSSYLGGSADESGYGIALDAQGNAYISGNTGIDEFPHRPMHFDRRVRA